MDSASFLVPLIELDDFRDSCNLVLELFQGVRSVEKAEELLLVVGVVSLCSEGID